MKQSLASLPRPLRLKAGVRVGGGGVRLVAALLAWKSCSPLRPASAGAGTVLRPELLVLAMPPAACRPPLAEQQVVALPATQSLQRPRIIGEPQRFVGSDHVTARGSEPSLSSDWVNAL